MRTQDITKECRRYARTLVVFMLALVVFEAEVLAQAEPYYPMMPARSLGNAGGGRSFAAGGNALFLNPASLAVTRQYILGGGYTLARSGTDASYAHGLNVEWTDSTPNAMQLGMGLAYSYMMQGDKKTQNVHGAMTYTLPFQVVGVHLGVGMHWLQDHVADLADEDDLYSADVGIAFNFQNQLTLGVVGHNLINSPDNGAPMGVGAGLSYWAGPVVLSGDVLARLDADDGTGTTQETLMSYVGGLQYMISQGLFARGAFRFDDGYKTATGEDAPMSVGGGLTYVAGNRVGVELGYRQGIDNPDDMMIGLNLELYNPFGTVR